jgi:hypothetical protein
MTPLAAHRSLALGTFRQSGFFVFAIGAFTERDEHTRTILTASIFLLDVASWHLSEVVAFDTHSVYASSQLGRNEPKPEIRQNEPNVWRMNSKLGDCALGESATPLCNNAETPPQQTETSKIGRYRAHPIRRPAPSGVCAAPLL